MSLLLKHDPGPCPVDDCPHTTCVAPETTLSQVVLPARDGVRTPRRSVTFGQRTAASFSTAEYRGDERRRRVKEARR